MRPYTVLLESDTLSNFATNSFPIQSLTKIFAAGKNNRNDMSFVVLRHHKRCFTGCSHNPGTIFIKLTCVIHVLLL